MSNVAARDLILDAGNKKMELWGGVECTVNRLGNSYMDQLDRTGHLHRLSDFDLFKGLGVSTLRHPVLWEKTAPDGLASADWSWADRSLARIQDLGIRPIVGLIHHGSGPTSTSLLDPEFPEKLAAYAEAVASRYPWVQDYTPVNEPLTTARFSGLYGHWYPHAHDDFSFVRALLNQCRGIVLAMRSIRKINPTARLIQTEDLGKIFSTPKLAYQADFENHRRWCSFDLLVGHVDRHHPLWRYFKCAGAELSEMEWFLDNPCPPDILGVNHYLSGERYLDEQLHRYPEYTHGGNGVDRYADVLAARVLRDRSSGPASLFCEVWDRYRLPLAITECHNGCTREEQLRWFVEIWNAAKQARADGAEVVAVTAWSLLGAFNWNKLVTRDDNSYEPGVFDIRSSTPRPTAMVDLLRDLAAGRNPNNPVLDEAGWWKRRARFIYGFSIDDFGRSAPVSTHSGRVASASARPLLITGGESALGKAFARGCVARGIAHHLLNRAQCDLTDHHSIRRAVASFDPWAVINTDEFGAAPEDGLQANALHEDEDERDQCYRRNTLGPELLARECASRDIRLLTFSSDRVFSGSAGRPYVESDEPDPDDFYGLTKVEGERRVLQSLPSAFIVRTGPLFGPWDEQGSWDEGDVLISALQGTDASADGPFSDHPTNSPTYVPDLVTASLDLFIDGEKGIWHLTNAGAVSWADMVAKAALLANLPLENGRRHHARRGLTAKRPPFTALSSERGLLMPTLEDALVRFVRECEQHLHTAMVAA